mgnify:CR=1 FL=1
MNFPLTIPSAEPFLHAGDRVGCLLLHGFSGTPYEMRPLGDYLASQGHTVLGMRLAGHATDPTDLSRVQWRDWLASVEDGLNLLKGVSDQQIVIGLSMGGVLTLLAAAHYPVTAMVTLSAPFELPGDWRLNFLPVIKIFMPYAKNEGPQTDEEVKTEDHPAYLRVSTRAADELKGLVREMQVALPFVHVPALLLQARHDGVIPAESMDSIYQRLGTPDKQEIWIENGGHVITLGPDRQVAFEAIGQFVNRVTGVGSGPV